MAHFASVNLPSKLSAAWPANFGTVYNESASISAVAFGAVGASPFTGITEGSDLHTYTVPAGETGIYLVATSLVTDATTASDAGTSQTAVCQVAYNNGAAVSALDVGEAAGGGGSVTVVKMDTTTASTELGQLAIIKAVTATDIVVTTEATNGGTVATEGTVAINVVIVRIA